MKCLVCAVPVSEETLPPPNQEKFCTISLCVCVYVCVCVCVCVCVYVSVHLSLCLCLALSPLSFLLSLRNPLPLPIPLPSYQPTTFKLSLLALVKEPATLYFNDPLNKQMRQPSGYSLHLEIN